MELRKKIRLGLLLLLLLFGSLVVWAVRVKIFKKPVAKAVIKPPSGKTYDPVLLKKFELVASSLNLDKNCTYNGVLDITDGADTAKSVKNLGFLVCKKGQNCYMQFGHTETLNANGLYVFIEHDQKKVVVGAQKIINTAPVADPSSFKKNMVNENYDLSSETAGSQETIIFKNPRHLTCKEYMLSYDTIGMHIKRIMAHLTNIRYPLNIQKDKIIDMKFYSWTETADLKKYLKASDVIEKNGNEVTLKDKYKDYELIRLQ